MPKNKTGLSEQTDPAEVATKEGKPKETEVSAEEAPEKQQPEE